MFILCQIKRHAKDGGGRSEDAGTSCKQSIGNCFKFKFSLAVAFEPFDCHNFPKRGVRGGPLSEGERPGEARDILASHVEAERGEDVPQWRGERST